MGYSIEMKVNPNVIYTIYGHRLTTNENGLNKYDFSVIHSPLDFYHNKELKDAVTVSCVAKGTLKHQYDDGLLILCEKALHEANKQLEERNKNENTS